MLDDILLADRILSQIIAVLCFIVWYYPVGQYRNASATGTANIRGFLAILIIWVTFLFASSLAHLLIAGVDSEEVGGALATIMSIMLYAFCGILVGPKQLPGFWIFMYRVNPFTYLVSGLMSATLGDAPAFCAENEYQRFSAPANMTCREYLALYISAAGGYVDNPQVQGGGDEQCRFCQIENTDQFLKNVNVEFGNRWRDFGFLWVYVVVNVVGAVGIYWLCRVPKGRKRKST